MKKLLMLCSFVSVLAVAACGGGGAAGSGDGGKCGGSGCGGTTENPMAQMMVDQYKNGTSKAMYYVALHKDAKAGQYWEVKSTSEFSGYKSENTDKWQVAAVTGDGPIVENFMGSMGIVLAYLIDTSKSAEDAMKTGNVKKAWVGKPGDAPAEIKIMDIPTGGETGPAPEKNYEDKTEDFTDVEIAGGKWSGKKFWMKMKDGSMESTTWTATNGWFNGLIKMESKMAAGTSNMELSKFGEDGKPWLKW
ncbi:MAG: hypothetical protein HPKKFMNG_01010 [Planctomycetes bacterium]|nr:hypothetical protein [Planctomycetota bacterium]MCQ3949201.1 hypothetical protein [Planctomycetota bacterium]GIK53073.1 MAG: hypothetical protein BroJett014_20460 [Planctomycetota bacterium]HRJ79018.1 hypothetical protein [Planctomycetota bacterium]